MKRTIDKPYFTYTIFTAYGTGINVKCPKCGGFGTVTVDDDNAFFRCKECSEIQTKERTIYRYDVHAYCEQCGRYYRVDITDANKQHFKVLDVTCPYCGYTNQGEMHKVAEAYSYWGEIDKGYEPYFGLKLWFIEGFDGKLIWAINREHLAYLIDYLRADLRGKPWESRAKKTQADHLPTFMKTAKNREKIVKTLLKLQKK